MGRPAPLRFPPHERALSSCCSQRFRGRGRRAGRAPRPLVVARLVVVTSARIGQISFVSSRGGSPTRPFERYRPQRRSHSRASTARSTGASVAFQGMPPKVGRGPHKAVKDVRGQAASSVWDFSRLECLGCLRSVPLQSRAATRGTRDEGAGREAAGHARGGDAETRRRGDAETLEPRVRRCVARHRSGGPGRAQRRGLWRSVRRRRRWRRSRAARRWSWGRPRQAPG